MRKRLLSSVLVVVLTFCMVSTTAFAWDETGMTARFNYTKETEVSEPPSDSNIPKYEVLIPAPTSLNQTDRLNIALAYNGLGEGETVVVSVNRTTFGEDGYFHLTSDTGGDLKAVLDRYGSSMPESERIDAEEGPFIVAVFDNSSMNPIQYGSVIVSTVNDNLIPDGEYIGYMHFTIELGRR